jgi:hypothetical protein
MSSLPASPLEDVSAVNVRSDENNLIVDLSDGRIISVPLSWFPRLFNATPEQRNKYELSRYGIHWEEIDEDLSVAGLLRGTHPGRTRGQQ